MAFDLLTTVEYGGCSAKLAPGQLAEALAGLPKVKHPNLLVDIETHDDAGVYRISPDLALVQTTDFFPPVCSDPFEFGQIAAANALSDVYAMGGIPITALNIALFPSTRIPLEVLKEILRGGMAKVNEAGAVIVGGHTIEDYPPKYGLAVTGTVHPDAIITNAGARPGDLLLLTKPIGTGVLVAGQRVGEAREADYRGAIGSMMRLNRAAGDVARRYGVRGGTDITGFGLLGHAGKLALASGVTLEIESSCVPLLPGALDLVQLGCIPGAAFRNLAFVESFTRFGRTLDYSRKMLMVDAQTSGGLLLCVPEARAREALTEVCSLGDARAAIIGVVTERAERALSLL